MKFIGLKQDSVIVYPPLIAEQKKLFFNRIKDGNIVETTIKVKRNSKSQNQLGAYWGLAMGIALDQLDDRGFDTSFILNTPNPTGIAIDKDLLCEYFYSVCPIFRDGKRITLSKMDTVEAAKFFDDVRNFMASQWSIHVPEPDKNWREK